MDENKMTEIRNGMDKKRHLPMWNKAVNGEVLQTRSERNEGVELFRCVSMVLILVLHILGQGGVLANSSGHKEQYCTAWFLEVIGYCSVDCYALISGYVNKEHDFKISRFVLLWLEVFFWLFVPLVVTKYFFTDISINKYVSKSFLPLTSKTLWYFNAYILLLPFIPILNIGLEKIEKRNYESILIFLFLTTCSLHIFNGGDNFVLSNGYCGMWLIILFVFGAYFRLYGIPQWAKWYVTIPLFFASAVFAWAMKMYQVEFVNANVIDNNGAVSLSLGRFVNHTSPFLVIMSLCLLLFFAQVRIKPRMIKKGVVLLGRCSFGVYLFHVGPIMWENFMNQRYKEYATYSPLMLGICVIATAVFLFIIFDLLSIIRHLFFKYCGINRFVERAFARLKCR